MSAASDIQFSIALEIYEDKYLLKCTEERVSYLVSVREDWPNSQINGVGAIMPHQSIEARELINYLDMLTRKLQSEHIVGFFTVNAAMDEESNVSLDVRLYTP